jgi:hypothetical protein
VKRVELTLPDEAYYEYQTKAGQQRRDTKDLMEEVLIRESGIEKEQAVPDTTQTFREYVIQWNWPNGPLKRGTEKASNVVGVVERMKNGFDFPDAIKQRAKDARSEDPTRKDQYNKTVRADCSKKGQGVTDSADQFRREVEQLLHEYEQD